MKNAQQEEAKDLYFQTNMSKTEIANTVGVNRRTILRWCAQDNWEKLRQSSRHMPALVAEKCYYLIDIYTSRLLQDPSLSTLTLKEAQTLHLLATTIKKIKNRSTINESMEMFNFFLEGLKKKDPQLAAEVLPEMEEYMTARRNRDVNDFLLQGFDKNGTMEFPHHEIEEQFADSKDLEALDKEIQTTPNYDQALENWQKAATPQNEIHPENEQVNEQVNDTISTHTTHSTSPAPQPVLSEVEVERAGERSDKNGTFLPKKQLIINQLTKNKFFEKIRHSFAAFF